MVIKMNKIKIFLPIIKINVDCSIRTKEKCGLFEYTILYIYNQFNKNKFNNFTFKDFINKVLKTKVPDIFIEEALDYLNNNRILTTENEGFLIDLPISSFKVSCQQTLETVLEKKELYSKSQANSEDLYYDPLSHQIINIDDTELLKEIEKPFINGEQFKHRFLIDSKKHKFIELLKKHKSSFNKEGLKIDDINENKREILYRAVEVMFTLKQSSNNEYSIEFDEEYKFLEPYLNQFIDYVFENHIILKTDLTTNLVQIESVKHAYNNIILSNIDNIEKYVQSKLYLIFDSNNNSEPSEDYKKFYLQQHFRDEPCFIVKDSIYLYRKITINGVSKNVFFYNTEKEEIYNKYIVDFIANLFKNIKEKSFYTTIEQLSYFINANQKELIVNTIINQLIGLDIFLFVNRIVSIKDILNINKSYLKYFNENIYNRYFEKSNYSEIELTRIFSDWKYKEDTRAKVKIIQNDMLSILKKSENLNGLKNHSVSIQIASETNKILNEKIFVLDTNILIKEGIKALKKRNLILSKAVIEELDNVKKKQPDKINTINEIVKYLNASNRNDIKFEESINCINLLPNEYNRDKIDNMILSLCLKDIENRILVTNDKNLQLKAKADNIKTINSGIFLKEK